MPIQCYISMHYNLYQDAAYNMTYVYKTHLTITRDKHTESLKNSMLTERNQIQKLNTVLVPFIEDSRPGSTSL